MQAVFLSVFSPRTPPPPLPHRFLVSHRLSFRAAVSFTSGITKEKTHEKDCKLRRLLIAIPAQ